MCPSTSFHLAHGSSSSHSIQVMNLRKLLQPSSGILRRNVPLRIPQQFIPHHKLLHRSRSQERREIMRMKMPLRIIPSVRGPLVKPHRIRKRSFKQVVVPNRAAPQNVRKQLRFALSKLLHRCKMSLADQQRFERPHSPKWSHHSEPVILANHPLASRFKLQVIAEQARLCRFTVCPKRSQFLRRGIRHRRTCPNLTVRMRIARPHQRPAVLENLHVAHPIDLSQSPKFRSPYPNRFADRLQRHPRNRQVMPRRKTDHPANPFLRARHQQAPFFYFEVRRIRQKRRKIIVKYKCAGVLRIPCAIRPLISWAQVASRIVGWQIRRRRLLHLPKPRPFRSMRRHQHPLARQWIEPSMWHFLQQRSIHAFHKLRRLACAFLSGSPSEGFQPSLPLTPLPVMPRKYKCPAASQLRPRTPPKPGSETPPRAPRPQN